tara:strand:+ start:388 stop:549 length:162 start_codon:yes stop_codon:yes gene_type:complete
MANPRKRKLRKLRKLRAADKPAQEIVEEVVAELPPIVKETQPKKSIFKTKKGK